MASRKCSRCGMEKPESMFYLIKSQYDIYCKECRREYRRNYEKCGKSKVIPKKKKCTICSACCDGTLVVGGIVRCSKCFDKIVYGENPTMWTLPQRSAMLL